MTATDLGIPGYEDITEVNRGGFATIYRARQPTFERDVAIKVLSAKPDEASLRRFRRECAAIGALSGHPNIVTVYEAGTTGDGRPFIVMEFLQGGSLADRIVHSGPLPVPEVLEIGGRVAGALESAHRAGILHRDLKPENILLSRLGEPKVGDFGLAQLPGVQPTMSGGLTGTLVHAAPELLGGDTPTVASDVYSLASTLFCLLAGRPPFAHEAEPNLMALIRRITAEPPPDLRTGGIPDALCRVVEQGLAKSPADRQRDVAQFGRQLQAVQAALGQPITRLPIEAGEPSRPAPAPASVRGAPTPRPVQRRQRIVRLTAAAVLGIAAVLSIVVPLARRGPAPLPVLYQDNFDAGQNWYEHDDAGATLSYDGDGHYRIDVKQPHQVTLSDTSFRGGVYGEPLTALTDVSVRVRAYPTEPGAIAGLFCRYRGGTDYYHAVVRDDGAALIMKARDKGVEPLASGRAASATRGRYVSLRLDCTGGATTTLALYVDGKKVAEAKDRDAIRVGSVGMLASADQAKASVLFEEFVLRGRRQAT